MCYVCCQGFAHKEVRLASRANPDRYFRHPACIPGGIPAGTVEGLAALPEEARAEVLACMVDATVPQPSAADAPSGDPEPRHTVAAEAGNLPGLTWWDTFDLQGALREPVPTWTAVPDSLAVAVGDLLAAALKAVATDPAREAAWARLLLLPRMLFAIPPAAPANSQGRKTSRFFKRMRFLRSVIACLSFGRFLPGPPRACVDLSSASSSARGRAIPPAISCVALFCC